MRPRKAPRRETGQLSETATVSATGFTPPPPRLARDTESPHQPLWDLYVEPARWFATPCTT